MPPRLLAAGANMLSFVGAAALRTAAFGRYFHVGLIIALLAAAGPAKAFTCTTDPIDCPVCQKASCTGTNQWTCSAVTNGTSCDDGNACTFSDHCQGGVCTGTDLLPES
jgi:hypothetical protein